MPLLKSSVLALLLCSSSVFAAAPPVPGDAEQVFTTWLAAFNSGKREDLQAYIDKHRQSRQVQSELDLRESLGPLKWLGVKSSTPEKVEVMLLSEDSDRGVLATLWLNPQDRREVSKFQLEGMELPAEHRPQPMAMPALLAEGKARLDSLQASDKLSGGLLVAKDGGVLLEWYGGLADRQRAMAVDKTTKFRLASLNKMFTAVAILQLRDAGQLSLEDPLARHLPDYPNQEIARAITLRQMLSHTSGLGDIFGEEFDTQSQSLRTHRDYWRVFSALPLKAVPGSEDHYSNYAYILLGSVIEAVSGQSYYDYVAEHIYRVAGMDATGAEPESTPVAERAIAYTQAQGKWVAETASLPWRGTAAGGGYSTLGDMLKFSEALRGGKLVAPASLLAATTPQNNKAWYGYGFMVSGQGNARQYGHEGGAAGANTALLVVPDKGYVVVGLSNVDPAAMENVVNFIGHRLPR